MTFLLAAREYDVIAFEGLVVELGDVLRRVLQVAIHHDRPPPAALRESRRDGGVLAEIAAQPVSLHRHVGPRQFGRDLPGAAIVAVVDQHDFVGRDREVT